MVQAFNAVRPNRSYGWRPSHPDIRDLMYTPRPTAFATLPTSFNLNLPSIGSPFDPVWDQSAIGSCGPHTEAANIVYALIKSHNQSNMPSRLFLYYTTRMLMGTVNSDSGVDNRSMLKALAQFGWCDESLWPYNIKRFTERPPQTAFEQAKTRSGAIEYRSVPQDLSTMKACLYETKRPIIFGFTVYSSLETPQVDNSGDIPMPMMGDVIRGGHDVLLTGWNDITQRFTLRNSWSPSWGKEGYGSVPYAYATNPRLSTDFWVVLKSPSGTPTPDPIPIPIPDPSPVPDNPSQDIKPQIAVIFKSLRKQNANNPPKLNALNIVEPMINKYLDSLLI